MLLQHLNTSVVSGLFLFAIRYTGHQSKHVTAKTPGQIRSIRFSRVNFSVGKDDQRRSSANVFVEGYGGDAY